MHFGFMVLVCIFCVACMGRKKHAPSNLEPSCSDFGNCWACGSARDCAWCGSTAQCQHFNLSQCVFTQWVKTCCRTLTPFGCDACLAVASCGWCENNGCTEGDKKSF